MYECVCICTFSHSLYIFHTSHTQHTHTHTHTHSHTHTHTQESKLTPIWHSWRSPRSFVSSSTRVWWGCSACKSCFRSRRGGTVSHCVCVCVFVCVIQIVQSIFLCFLDTTTPTFISMNICTHTCSLPLSHTHTLNYTCIHFLSLSHTHIYTHTNTHTHTLSHTHTRRRWADCSRCVLPLVQILCNCIHYHTHSQVSECVCLCMYVNWCKFFAIVFITIHIVRWVSVCVCVCMCTGANSLQLYSLPYT
jgi:hypothetical protein